MYYRVQEVWSITVFGKTYIFVGKETNVGFDANITNNLFIGLKSRKLGVALKTLFMHQSLKLYISPVNILSACKILLYTCT